MICYPGNTLNLFAWFCPLAILRSSFPSMLSVGCRMNMFKRKICSRMGFLSLLELLFTSGPSWGCFFPVLCACVSGACLPLVFKPLTPQVWPLWEQSIGSFRWNEGGIRIQVGASGGIRIHLFSYLKEEKKCLLRIVSYCPGLWIQMIFDIG